MIIKKNIAAFISAVLVSVSAAAVQAASAADADNGNSSETTAASTTTTQPTTLRTYHIVFLDFDGKKMAEFDIEEGDPINYSALDTESLHKHLGVNTEQAFSSWDIKPDFADKDYTIHALSKTATLTFNAPPKKTRYFSNKGNVSLDGLDVSIKISVQTPEKDKNGRYITEESIINVSKSCVASPASLSSAFAKGDKAVVTIYPLGDQKSLYQYDIFLFNNLGDTNEDGSIDSIDASQVLMAYANMAASQDYTVSDKFKKLADVDMNGRIDSADASYILKYYAEHSTSSEFIDWDNIIDYDKLAENK